MTVGVVSAAAKELTREVLRIMLLKKLTLAIGHAPGCRPDRLGASAALVSFGG